MWVVAVGLDGLDGCCSAPRTQQQLKKRDRNTVSKGSLRKSPLVGPVSSVTTLAVGIERLFS